MNIINSGIPFFQRPAGLYQSFKKLSGIAFPEDGYCQLFRRNLIYGCSQPLVQACISDCLIIVVNRKAVLRAFIFYNIISFEYMPYFILCTYIRKFFNNQKIHSDWLFTEMILSLKFQNILVGNQFQFRRAAKPRMPLNCRHFLIRHRHHLQLCCKQVSVTFVITPCPCFAGIRDKNFPTISI